MKKIGILTFHWENNYGAVIQCYSLAEYISSIGYEVKVVNFLPLDLKYSTQILPFSIAHMKSFGILKFIRRVIYSIVRWNPVWINRIINFNSFRRKFIKTTRVVISEKEFIEQVNEFDFLVVGSDQVWNLDIIESYKDFYFMTLSGISVNLISYSASFGSDISNLEDSQKDYIIEALSKFSFISVRETDSKLKLEQLGIKNTYVHLDPVFLLPKYLYNELSNKLIEDKIILVYDLQPIDNLGKIIGLLNARSYKVYYYNTNHKYVNNYFNYFNEGPLGFLDLLNRAEFVVTNSFHGLSLSILYEKQFYVVVPTTRGDRLVDLLTLVRLMDRIIDDDRPSLSNARIDYNRVNKILQSKIEESRDYFKKVFESSKDLYRK